MAVGMKKFRCLQCGKEFEVPENMPDPNFCPYCGAPKSKIVHIYDKDYQPAPSQPVIPPQQPSGTMRRFICLQCNNIIEVPFGQPKPMTCPYCGAPSYMIKRLDKPGWGRRWGP